MPCESSMSLIADQAPSDDALTDYDRRHLVVYLRLLDAETAGADWQEVARIVLERDPETDSHRAHQTWESHLARARWMTTHGYAHLLQETKPRRE